MNKDAYWIFELIPQPSRKEDLQVLMEEMVGASKARRHTGEFFLSKTYWNQRDSGLPVTPFYR
jgi:hypothetical protein